MPMTRVSVETILISRVGKRLTASGIYSATTDTIGSIAALSWPISRGLASLGVAAADVSNPADDDLAGITDEPADPDNPAVTPLGQLLDVAELYALEAAWGNLDEADERTGTQTQNWDKYATNLWNAIQVKRKRLEDLYGIGSSDGLSAGTVALNFDRASWCDLDYSE